MRFQLDYTKFFDLQEANSGTYAWTKQDFLHNFSQFLIEHDIMEDTAIAIASAVFERMADRRLHYHTPVHVLSMFQFAEREFPNEKLMDWEELAIWFHDSVYIPQLPGASEELSIMFMRAMVGPAFSESLLAAASYAIETTSQHLEKVTNNLYDTIMDLDLAHFSLPDLTAHNDAIRREFGYVDEAEYNKGRKSFLEKLLSRGFVFRSQAFKDRYEAFAVKNILKEIRQDGN